MQKCLILFLAIISLTVQARANWNPYSMDHERFVHLSENDKRKVIIKTMEFMVELESRYKKDVEVTGYSQDKWEKYVKAIKQLEEFLLSSAYAQGDIQKLRDQATKFGNLLSKLGSDGCVYGGYVSRMSKTSSGLPFCQHPNNVKGTDEKSKLIRQAYLSNTKEGNCVAPSRISCNPIIFGMEDGKPYCVPTSGIDKGKAHNVSYECMKKALAGTEEQKNARLNVVVQAMEGHADLFKQVHGFVFKTCACGETSINAEYAKYIRPHRTCFGMMNTLRVMKNNECAVMDEVDPTDFADEWAQYFGNQTNFPSVPDTRRADFDDVYQSLIDKDAVKAICENMDSPTEKQFVCSASCSPIEGSEKRLCKVDKAVYLVKKGSQSKEEPVELESTEIEVEDPQAEVLPVVTKKGQTLECKIAVKEDPNAGKMCTLTVEPQAGEDKTKALVKIAYQGYGEKDKFVATWPDQESKEEKSEMIYPKDKEAKTIKVTYTVNDQAGEKQVCEATIPAIDPNDLPKDEYKIDAVAESPKNPKDPMIKVNATVTKNGEPLTDLTGLTITWTRKGYKGPAPTKPEEKKKSDKVGEVTTTPDGDVITANTDKENDKGSPGIDAPVGTGPSILEPRTSEKYQSCANLMDEKKTVLATDCDDIAPLTPEQPQMPQLPPGPQQGPMFITPLNNTRLFGI